MEAKPIGARRARWRAPPIPIHPLPVILGFLLGSIPWGLWIGRARGVDLRTVGSGNIGATNAFRVLGAGVGAVVFALDALKGTAAVLLAADLATQIAAGVASILGHIFSPWVRFKGGRGVATSLGVFLALLPVPSVLAFSLWVVLVAISRRVSVGSIGAALAYPFLAAFFLAGNPHRVALVVTASLIAALLLVRHVPNLRRLLAGTEPPTFGRKEPKGGTP